MQLFKERLTREWRFHQKLLKDIIDWTILLYAMIPTGAFLYFLYRETVLRGEFGFFVYIPIELFVLVLILLGSLGYMRTFIEPADRLFIIQHTREFTKLKRLAIYYSVIWQAGFITGILLLLSPVLFSYYELLAGDVLQLGLAMLLYFFLNRCIEWSHIHKWLQGPLGLLAAAGVSGIILYVPAIATFLLLAGLLLVLLFIEMRHIRSSAYFEKQLEHDLKAHTRWISRLFFFNNELKSMIKENHTVKAPWLLKGRLFQHADDAVAELLVKTLIRNKRYRWGYVRLVAITIPLYLALPFWADVLLLGFSYLMLTGWFESVMLEVKGHAMFTVLKLQDEQWNTSMKKLKAIFVAPVLLCMGLFVIIGFMLS